MFYPHFKVLDLDIPLMSLSGQILSKFAKSSDGRALSIGTQYLNSKPCEDAITDTETNKPYRVQSLRQSPLLRPTTDKVLHNLYLLRIPSLESPGVVENITTMLCEGNFVLDVVQTTLRVESSQSAIADKDKPA
jgi:hypothetical protein